MSARSALIMGLRLHHCNAQSTKAGLARLQNERQRGKGTGCHNLASHSGQEQQLQTHRNQARAPTPASAHMDARSSGRKQAVYNQTPSCSLMHGTAVPRKIELAEGRRKKVRVRVFVEILPAPPNSHPCG